MGNHESFPVNMIPMPGQTSGKYNPGWLYSAMAEYYKEWLPEAEQQNTLKEGGYYTVRNESNMQLIK